MERCPANGAEEDVLVPDNVVALRIAHGRGSIAATAGLVKQNRAVLALQGRDQVERGGRRGHAQNIAIHVTSPVKWTGARSAALRSIGVLKRSRGPCCCS